MGYIGISTGSIANSLVNVRIKLQKVSERALLFISFAILEAHI